MDVVEKIHLLGEGRDRGAHDVVSSNVCKREGITRIVRERCIIKIEL